MGTRTVRIIDEYYHDCIDLLNKENKRLEGKKTEFQKHIMSSEMAWISFLLNKGIKKYTEEK